MSELKLVTKVEIVTVIVIEPRIISPYTGDRTQEAVTREHQAQGRGHQQEAKQQPEGEGERRKGQK